MTTAGTYKALCFDFDGVIGKTMEDNLRAWQLALSDVGEKINRSKYLSLEGMQMEEIAKKFCPACRANSALAKEIVAKKDEYYEKISSFKLYPGVREFISVVAGKKIPIALVTAGKLARITKSLAPEFLKQFTALVTAEQSGKGKPHPDPYLAAARLLNIPIAKCIVVENAPLGIQSAKAAGAYCVALASTLPKSLLREADTIIGEFWELTRVPAVSVLLGEYITPQKK